MKGPASLSVALVAGLGCASPGGGGARDGSAPDARVERDAGDAPAAPPTEQDPTGLWYLDAQHERLTLDVAARDDGPIAATLRADGGRDEPLRDVAWDAPLRVLRFRRELAGGSARFTLALVEGVAVGSVGGAPGAVAPRGLVTGWSARAFDRDLVPRVFDVRWNDGRLGTLRIDRDAAGHGLVGTLKVYATAVAGAWAEGEERDLDAVGWDGATLSFEVDDDATRRRYRGVVAGRAIRGEAVDVAGGPRETWAGARAEVLTHGLTARPDDEAEAWRSRTRARLAHLMMGGGPAPASASLTVLGAGLRPFASGGAAATRDDDAGPSQRYALSELRWTYEIADPAGGPPATRTVHGLVARPTAAPPTGGYPVVIALNGHAGSAWATMHPDSGYWYGDAFARRGYVVVAIDVSHRPPADRAGLYRGYPDGDDPLLGNGPHPAVSFSGDASAWQEDGERAWDAMRAIDHALALPDVDRDRVAVTGLSLGGEVATFAGALDPRAAAVVAAGFAPDLHALSRRANHGCWRWTHGDVTEYLDVSDLHALIAPRRLVVESGAADRTYSDFRAPFAADKQVLRRSRAAYASSPSRVAHYLHGGGHVYRPGEPWPASSLPRGVSVPVLTAPEAPGSVAWQSDAATTPLGATVLDLLRDVDAP